MIRVVIKLGKHKVAIIGAGLSGLACALELKRNGITPVVFERAGRPGGGLDYLLLLLKMFNRPMGDPMRYMKARYRLELSPVCELTDIIMKGPTRTMSVHGRLGHIFLKGSDADSMEEQLITAGDIDVRFDTIADVGEIYDRFSHIVVASGSCSIPKEYGGFDLTFQSHTRIARILGEFETGVIKMWLNREYCNSGYVYMVSGNPKYADLVMSVTDTTNRELEYYWRKFLTTENIVNPIVTTDDVEQHLGHSTCSRNGKLYFIGNAGGMIDNFLGFGAMRSLESGVLAARSIAGGYDFNRMMKPYMAEALQFQEYRKMVDRLDNKGFDRLITIIGMPIIKQLIYKNPFHKAKHTVLLPKLYNRFNHRIGP